MKPSFKVVPADRSPERAALAEKIASRDAIAAEIGGLERALATASDRRHALYAQIDEANETIRSAPPDSAGERLANDLLGSSVDTSTSQAAREAIARAEAEQPPLDEAIEILEGKMKAALGKTGLAQMAVEIAVSNVVRTSPALAAAKEAFMTAQAAYLERRAALEAIWGACEPGPWPAAASIDLAAASAWTAAVGALASDADAALP